MTDTAAKSSAAPGGPQSTTYTAFISYAREDAAFARQLEAAIETYQSVGTGAALTVFRDESDFTGNEYSGALEGHLEQAASLIVVCSPSARRSAFVGDEIERFAALHGTQRIFPVLVDGLPDNEAEEKKSFPEALVKVLSPIPLAADYRGFDSARRRFNDPRFESEWFKLLANLQDLSPADIRARDKQHQVHALRMRIATIAAVLLVMAGLASVMTYLWVRARRAETREQQTSERAQTELSAKDRELETSERARRELEELTARLRKTSSPGPTVAPPSASASSTARGGGAAPVPQPVPPPPPAPSVPTEIKSRVYFHIRDDNQRAVAVQMQARLRAGGYIVPGIQTLRVGPSASELRYFRKGDEAEAKTIAGVLGLSGLGLKLIPGYETSTDIRPHHFELWLAPPTP